MGELPATPVARVRPPRPRRADAGRARLEWLTGNTVVLDALIVSLLALVLGLIRLGAPSFWVDESFTARALERSLPDLVDRQYHLLYYLLLKPWAFVAGPSEWALRLPSVVGLMLACGLLVVLARKFFDRHVALVSGMLLATSPFLVKWSQQARGYSFALAVSLLATLVLLRALERNSRGAWGMYGLALSAVVVWHPVPGVLLVLAHAVLVAQRRERVFPHGLLAAVVVGAVAVPWAAVVAMRSTGEGVAMNWLKFPSAEVAVRALLDVSGAAGVGLALAIAGLWVLRRAGRHDLTVWLGTWASAPFALSLLVSVVRPIYLDRYLIVAAPAFALLASIAVTGLAPRLRGFAVLAVVAATSLGLAQWYAAGVGGNWRGEDWRGAVRTVLERRSEADAVVVAEWAAHPAAEYYGAQVSDISTADSIWVIRWSETANDLVPAERRALGFGEHRLMQRISFGERLSAQLWRRPP